MFLISIHEYIKYHDYIKLIYKYLKSNENVFSPVDWEIRIQPTVALVRVVRGD